MDLMHIISCIMILLYLLFALTAETAARPYTDLDTFISTPLDIERRFSEDFFESSQSHSVASKDSLLSLLRQGFYYIEDGKVTPVNPRKVNRSENTAQRRLDSDSNERGKNAKRKKLFVPNLFG